MERLTEKHFGNEGYYMKCSEDCHAPQDCIDCAAFEKLVDSLAAYEDTGLEPEEFKKAFNEDALLKLTAQYLRTTPDRLIELTQADKEGRLVALPCKVMCGTEIWWADPTIHTAPRKCEVSSFGVYSGPDGKPQAWMNCYVYGSDGESRSFRVTSIGKTVFLTREEAEAALAGEGGNA